MSGKCCFVPGEAMGWYDCKRETLINFYSWFLGDVNFVVMWGTASIIAKEIFLVEGDASIGMQPLCAQQQVENKPSCAPSKRPPQSVGMKPGCVLACVLGTWRGFEQQLRDVLWLLLQPLLHGNPEISLPVTSRAPFLSSNCSDSQHHWGLL